MGWGGSLKKIVEGDVLFDHSIKKGFEAFYKSEFTSDTLFQGMFDTIFNFTAEVLCDTVIIFLFKKMVILNCNPPLRPLRLLLI